jgi:cell division protein FtsQ
MERTLAGRGPVGRSDRPLARPAPRRAPRSRARAGAPRRARAAPTLRLTQRIEALWAGRVLLAIWARRRLRIALLLGALLSGLLSGGWLWLRHSSLAWVQRVQITGVHGPDASAIDAALSAAARRMSTLDVHLGALRAAMAPFVVVRDVRASGSFPHSLRIHVIEQPPVAALVAGASRSAVAADGVVLGPALLSGSLPSVDASRVPANGQQVSDAAASEALSVLGAAPAPLAKLLVRAYTGANGLTVVLQHGLSAYFGDASRPHAKWLSLALVLASPRSAGATYVDVRVPERPAAGFPAGSAPRSAQAGSSAAEGVGAPESAGALAAGLTAAVGREAGAGAPAAQQGAAEESHSEASGEGGGAASQPAQGSTGEASEAPAGGARR